MAGPFYDVTAEIEGRIYRGHWTLKQGGPICVSWEGGGSRTVELGKTRPEVKSVTVLRDLVKAHQRQREREQRALEVKRRQLSPNS